MDRLPFVAPGFDPQKVWPVGLQPAKKDQSVCTIGLLVMRQVRSTPLLPSRSDGTFGIVPFYHGVLASNRALKLSAKKGLKN
jgi:hypothetical protein